MARCDLLTNHARVLLCIARDPQARIRDIAQCAELTERATHRLVNDLCEAGYLDKRRVGPRNQYEIHHEMPLGHPLEAAMPIGELLTPLINHVRSRQATLREANAPSLSESPHIAAAS